MAATISEEEFADLYAATVRDLMAYVRRRTRAEVEDLVAEVYVVAWRRRARLPEEALRRAWLFGVARNLLKAAHRDGRRQDELVGQILGAPDEVGTGSEQEVVEAVDAALNRLSAGDREILRLTCWESLTPSELAVALGVRPATARVRLHRARRALAEDPEVRALVEPSTAVEPVGGTSRS